MRGVVFFLMLSLFAVLGCSPDTVKTESAAVPPSVLPSFLQVGQSFETQGNARFKVLGIEADSWLKVEDPRGRVYYINLHQLPFVSPVPQDGGSPQ